MMMPLKQPKNVFHAGQKSLLMMILQIIGDYLLIPIHKLHAKMIFHFVKSTKALIKNSKPQLIFINAKLVI